MGLYVSHDAWKGAYSAFHHWRCKICEVAGLPPFDLMEYFYEPLSSRYSPTLYSRTVIEDDSFGVKYLDERLPIKWDCLKPSPLHKLLIHSDCEGDIPWEDCKDIADALQALVSLMPEGGNGGHIHNWADKTQAFVDGLRRAYAAREDLEFS